MTPIPEGDQVRELVDRVRALLSGRPLREVRMFGVVAVLVDDAMAVGVHNDGSLLVRVDPAEDARLLESPEASRAQMGAGRSLAKGGSELRRAHCTAIQPSATGSRPPTAA
jgi:hypothetical protein